MEVLITYEKEDWAAFQAYLEREIPKSVKTPWDGFWVNLIVWAGIGAGTMAAFQYVVDFHWPSGLFVAAIFGVISVLHLRYLRRIKNGFAPSENGNFLGAHKFKFSDQGVEAEGDGYKAFHEWSVVQEIVRENGLIMLFVDTSSALIFPEAKIANPEYLYNYAMECNN